MNTNGTIASCVAVGDYYSSTYPQAVSFKNDFAYFWKEQINTIYRCAQDQQAGLFSGCGDFYQLG